MAAMRNKDSTGRTARRSSPGSGQLPPSGLPRHTAVGDLMNR